MAKPQRRQFLVGIAVIAGGYLAVRHGVPAAARLFAPELEFETVGEPAGFRRIAGGQSSRAVDPLAGVGGGKADGVPLPDISGDLCRVLFGGDVAHGTVPIAAFSDYRCPYCRVLSPRMNRLQADEGDAVRLVWHELPIFGEASVLAARAALAAKMQGAYLEFHERLIRTPFQTTADYLDQMARDLGLDMARFTGDMNGPEVDRALAESRAAARLFGFAGTPALVVGRTLVEGAIDDTTLQRLVARERADGVPGYCG